MGTVKRLYAELVGIEKEPAMRIHYSVEPNNLFAWKATMLGPDGSPYEGGEFDLTINIPQDFPFKPPKI